MAVTDTTTKTCTKCGDVKPLDAFSKDASRRDGLSNRCKSCKSFENAKWRAENPEKHKENYAKWYAANSEHARAYSSAYREAHPEQVKNAVKKWVESNSDRKRASMSAWYERNKQRVFEKNAEWRERNIDKVRSYRSNRKAKTRGKLGKLSDGIVENLYVLQKGKCACCRNKLSKYHVDHIIPLAAGGTHVDSNIQLLCPKCNLSKGAKHPVDFMQQRGFLL